jgi:putative phage-type endonuclease
MNIQRSPEWIAARVGKATASRIGDVVARTKTGWSALRANYMADLIAERLTGVRVDGYVSAAMAWGIEQEPQARAAYEFYCDATVRESDFIDHPRIARSGASPDGLVGDDGLVEFKCPNTATHIETLLGGSIPGDYVAQMQWQMACTGRAWCDFVSFDPRLPPAMSLHVRRVERDERTINKLEQAVCEFLAEIERKLADLDVLYRPLETHDPMMKAVVEPLAESGPALDPTDRGGVPAFLDRRAPAEPARVEMLM